MLRCLQGTIKHLSYAVHVRPLGANVYFHFVPYPPELLCHQYPSLRVSSLKYQSWILKRHIQ